MCFLRVNRWRSCQHDTITRSVAAFCTSAKAHARRASSIDFSYCGQGMCSPKYMTEYDAEDLNGGVCPACISEMGELAERDQQSQPSSRDDGGVPKTIIRLTGEELFAAYQRYRAAKPVASVIPTSHRNQIPYYEGAQLLPPTPRNQNIATTQTNATPQQHPQQRRHPQFLPQSLSYLSGQSATSPENSTTGSGSWSSIIVHRLFSNYPQSTRLAIEKAVANQTPEKRVEILRGYSNISAGFE